MKRRFLCFHFTLAAIALTMGLPTPTQAAPPARNATTRVPVEFSGGHETEGVDKGRPVVLIAAALGVAPQVFRDVFSNVRPAGAGRGGPSDREARANKKVLMDGLSKHGITNDRLDEVSNYYRYVRSRNELWTHEDAEAIALVRNGEVIGFEITKPGAGYSSTPTVTVPGVTPAPKVEVKLLYGKKLKTNGSIESITVLKESPKDR